MSVEAIFNYIKVNDRLSTAGQPTEEQLRDLAAEGFAAIINLAPVNPPFTPEDEAGLARALGLAYHYIPVNWNDPTDADFEAFERAMREPSAGKTLIHCAANFRVTAFYSIFARKHLGWSAAEAKAFRARIWAGSDYPVWEAFIDRKMAALGEAGMPYDDNWPKGVSAPARRALAAAGYHRLEQLAGVSETELLKLHGFGPKAIEVLRPALAALGLAFAGESSSS